MSLSRWCVMERMRTSCALSILSKWFSFSDVSLFFLLLVPNTNAFVRSMSVSRTTVRPSLRSGDDFSAPRCVPCASETVRRISNQRIHVSLPRRYFYYIDCDNSLKVEWLGSTCTCNRLKGSTRLTSTQGTVSWQYVPQTGYPYHKIRNCWAYFLVESDRQRVVPSRV